MMIWITSAKKTERKYGIQMEFNDGTIGVVDFEEILSGDHRTIIRELLDENKFNAFSVENDTICWNNGVDFAPEFLYENSSKVRKVA
jgi:hypothetical protein